MISELVALSQGEFATRLCVNKNTIGNYERGERQPDSDFLARLRSEFGVSIDWLLTGEEPMMAADRQLVAGPAAASVQAAAAASTPAAPVIDETLMGPIVEGISTVYKEEKVGVAPRHVGRLAARLHGDLVAVYDEPAERLVGLKALLQQLRRDLRATPDAGERGGNMAS